MHAEFQRLNIKWPSYQCRNSHYKYKAASLPVKSFYWNIIKKSSYQYRNNHHTNKIISWLSYFSNGNPHIWILIFYFGPGFCCVISVPLETLTIQSGTKPNLVAKIWLPTLVTFGHRLPKLVANISSDFHHLVNTGLAVGSFAKWLPIKVANPSKIDKFEWFIACRLEMAPSDRNHL